MKNSVLYLFAGLTLAIASSEGREAEKSKLFAAFAVTKSQQASSIPTDSGVFLYNEAASDWERMGPVVQFINSVTTDPSNPDTIFLACGNGVIRSLDGGETWRMTTGWRESDFVKIAVDPKNGDNVYASSVWGISVSRDGGDTWQRANKGLAERYSRTIIVDQRRPRRLLLATADGIYQSNDRANTWKAIDSSPKVAILRLARSEANLDLWIAGTEGKGVYLSTNDGKTWTTTAPQMSEANIYAVALDPKDPSRLAVAGWGTGVWFSSDGGETWVDRGEGLPSQNITSMSFDPKDTRRLWVSTFEEGTVYSDNNGGDWVDGGLMGAYVFDLGVISMN